MLTSPLRRMLWKETRELLPLWFAITFGSMFLQFLVSLNSFSSSEILTQLIAAIPAALVCAYTLSVGGVLFAGEKEADTLDFLRRLPCSARLITTSKLTAGIVSIALMLALLIPYTIYLVQLKGNIQDLFGNDPWGFAISLFVVLQLLVWGSLFSMLTGKVIWSILLGMAVVFTSSSFHPVGLYAFPFACLFLLAIKTRWFYDRPIFARFIPSVSVSIPLPKVTVTFPEARVDRGSPDSRLRTRLLWLEWRRARLFFYGILAGSLLWGLAIVAAESFVQPFFVGYDFQNNVRGPLFGIPIYLRFLVILLAGVSTYSSDQQQQQYRFLSDRGISASKVFSSKLFVWGLTVLFISCVVLSLLPIAVFGALNPPQRRMLEEFYLTFILLQILAFLVGQLASLLFRSTIVAIGMSLVGFLLLIGWMLLNTRLNVPFFLTQLPIPFILLLATRLRVSDWLNERNRFSHWLKFNACLFLPLLATASTLPIYRVYEIPYVDPPKYTVSLDEIALGNTEQRQLALELAIELRFLEQVPDAVRRRTTNLMRAATRLRDANPYSMRLFDLSPSEQFDLSPAEQSWENADPEERQWLEHNLSWLTRPELTNQAAGSILPSLQSEPLNSLLSRADRLTELTYLHHLAGSRLAAEGKLDESLQQHLRAIRIASLRWRIIDLRSPMGVIYQSPLAIRESEALLAWSFRWLHGWSLHPQQTSERLTQAIKVVDRPLHEFPSALTEVQLLGQGLDHDINYWSSMPAMLPYVSFLPSEQRRFNRLASLKVQQEMTMAVDHSNIPQSKSDHFEKSFNYAVYSFSIETRSLRNLHNWRIAAWQLLQFSMVLRGHQIQYGRFPPDLHSLKAPEYGKASPSASVPGFPTPIQYYPAGLDRDLDLITSFFPLQGPMTPRLPAKVPFLFLGQGSFIAMPPTLDTDSDPSRFQLVLRNPNRSNGKSDFDFLLVPLVPTKLILAPPQLQPTSVMEESLNAPSARPPRPAPSYSQPD